VPTWDSEESSQLLNEVCGPDCWQGALDQMAAQLRTTSDERIWNMRSAARGSLVEYIRNRHSQQIAIQGGSAREVKDAGTVFDANALTLGFARRFATYKRPNLLLHDPDRLKRILSDPQRPVQLVIAGKAHPQDAAGQEMIRQWSEFIHRWGVHSAVVFLTDYDMLMTERLVGGVDVWINTPRRPWEASGTSGMKVLVNGGLNLSETDGWWAEAYTPDVGWAIGDGREHGDDPAWDAAEAEAVYALLEQQIVPQFYSRNEAGIPAGWVARIRESMARLTPEFSANRAVREYTETYYVPSAAAYVARADDGGKLGDGVYTWQRRVAGEWQGVSFGPLSLNSKDDVTHFEVVVHLGELEPAAVLVELYAEGRNGVAPERKVMDVASTLAGNAFVYAANVKGQRPPVDYTPRVVPFHASASVPLEASQILWQK
jgi:starch phosphorylase